MIVANIHQNHQQLESDDNEVVLTGPPSALQGNLLLGNRSASDVLFITDIGLSMESDEAAEIQAQGGKLDVNIALNPRETKHCPLWLRLPPQTEARTYEGKLTVGGKEKPLRIIVQELVSIGVHPNNMHFLGVEPGKAYSAELSITNHGNTPFRIPNIHHNTVVDYDYLCRSLSSAIRDKGQEGFTAMMDEWTRNVQKDMPDWATLHIEEEGAVLDPGATTRLHLKITLPDNVDRQRDYFGYIRLWDQTISYAVKAHPTEHTTPRKRTKK